VKLTSTQHPRRFAPSRASAAALVVVAAAVVGGCGSSSSSGGGGQSSKELVIGVASDLSGPAGAFGAPQTNGARMVADAINASGGIKELGGAKIKLIVKDSKSDPVTAGQAIRQIAQQHPSAMFGPTISAETVANKPLIQSLKIPDFSGSIDTSVTQNNKYIFRLISEIGGQCDQVVSFVDSLMKAGTLKNVKSAGIVTFSNPPGPQTVSAFSKGLQKLGVKPVVVQYDPTQVKDYAPIVSKLRSANVDIVVGQIFPNDGTQIAQAIDRSGWKPQGTFWAGGAVFLESFRKTAGNAADDWTSAAYSANLDSDQYTPETQKLAAEYKKKYGGSMEGTGATIGASAVTLAADAAAAAKSTDPAKITEALRKLTFSAPKDSAYPYYMLTGGLKYDQNQDNSALVVPVIQWNAGTSFNTVYPSDVATGKYAPLSGS